MTQHIHPKLSIVRGGLFPRFLLLETYRYHFRHKGRKACMDIHAGFRYDGATMGSFLFRRKSIHESAHTLAHDYGYECLGDVVARYTDSLGRPNSAGFSLTRKEIDDMFLQGIRREVNVQDWRSKIASGAIKSVGWFLWKKREIIG